MFQFVGIMVNLIPIVDCSEAVHLRTDLTDEEKELCSATANFENIIALFMDKYGRFVGGNERLQAIGNAP